MLISEFVPYVHEDGRTAISEDFRLQSYRGHPQSLASIIWRTGYMKASMVASPKAKKWQLTVVEIYYDSDLPYSVEIMRLTVKVGNNPTFAHARSQLIELVKTARQSISRDSSFGVPRAFKEYPPFSQHRLDDLDLLAKTIEDQRQYDHFRPQSVLS